MRTLFDTTQINSMTMANRFVFSATWLGLADEEGFSTARQAEYLTELARRGVGLIITGHAFVMPEGKAGPRQTAVWDDRFIPGLTELADAVHAARGTVVLQLSHAGCYAAAVQSGLAAVGPSAGAAGEFPDCSALSVDGIKQIVTAFGQCAARGKAAGFDGVQIHAAHGYLISQFLSPYFNRRTDSYGGSIGNRSRFVIETLQAVREAVGGSYPVLVKMNSEDFLQGGLSVEEMLHVASLLEQAGIDAIEMSGGTIASGALIPIRPGLLERDSEAFYREAARRFKEQIGVPLLLVGGIRSLDVCKELVETGEADYLSLSRPFICEPDLVERWKTGDTSKSACISCNGCLRAGFRGKGVHCVISHTSAAGN